MFNTDKPITTMSEDKLGRSSFAKQLANAIMQFKTKDNYAISLQGKWGCGKTSVLNMTIEEIKQLSDELDIKERMVIVQFNPWNFTDTNQLINQFFLTLTNNLKFNNKEQKMQNIGEVIEKYSSALEYSEYIPMVGPYLKIFPKLASKLGKSIKGKAESQLKDVSHTKRNVEQALKDLDNRILVVIDDIDRLTNEQIKLVFQLVNSIAGFPNITYFLSFDKDVVVGALKEVQNGDGAEYLEKIIQIPFDLPPLNITKLHSILFEKLNELVELQNVIESDSERWLNVFNSCINPFIKTLRDVNRFCNSLSFMYETVREEVDFIDMAGMSSLLVFASPIFNWIRENKFSLVGGYKGTGISMNELDKQKEETLKYFQEVYPKNPHIMLNAVASLFPKFSNRNLFRSSFESPSEIHQAMRIASENKFDLYFSLSLDNIKISRKEIEESLFNMEEKELRSYISILNERELFGVYLEEIKLYLSNIPESRIELILSVLAFESGRIGDKEARLIGIDSDRISIYTISDLLFRINDENFRYTIISNMLSNTDFLSFQFLLHLLHIVELTHGRVVESPYMQKPKLVNIESLYKLEKIFLERTKIFVVDTNLLDWEESRRASFLWEFIEEKSYSVYIDDVTTNELYAIKFLVLQFSTWSSGGKASAYELKDDKYQEYINDLELIEAINKARLTKEFWKLDEKTIEASVAFILIKEISIKEKRIEIEDIQKRIDVWEKEFLNVS